MKIGQPIINSKTGATAIVAAADVDGVTLKLWLDDARGWLEPAEKYDAYLLLRVGWKWVGQQEDGVT